MMHALLKFAVRARDRALALVVMAGLTAGAQAQNGELNLFTDLGTPFPPGCLSIDLPEEPASPDSLLAGADFDVPSLNSDQLDATIRLRIWRVACADNNFSAVLVRMRQLGDPQDPDLPFVVVPQVFAEAGQVDVPFHEAHLQPLPAAGDAGATGRFITTTGTTWLLAVEPVSLDGLRSFTPADYNSTFTVEFDWSSFAPATTQGFRFLLDGFNPNLDPPQFSQPVLNGRYTGQWVRPGAPRQGLVLQIAEQQDQNFVFAIFFTYIDGQPVWVVGNSAPATTEPGPVTIAMTTLEGGAFIGSDDQPLADEIPVSEAGSIEIEVIDCNNLRVNYDFTPLGRGTGSMELRRLVRIAGYDCNPWVQ